MAQNPRTQKRWSGLMVCVCVCACHTVCHFEKHIQRSTEHAFPSHTSRVNPHLVSHSKVQSKCLMLRYLSSVFLCLVLACVLAFMWICVCMLGPLPVWLLDRVAWACLWLWLSDCPSGMKPAALLGRLNCWGRTSAGAMSSAKAKWNYTTDLTLQVVCRILLKSMDSEDRALAGLIRWFNLI